MSRPTFESLESRQLLSGSVISNAALIGLIDPDPRGSSGGFFFDRGAATTAGARTGIHREHCRGNAIDVVPGLMTFAGTGTATHFGRYTIVGRHNVDELGNVFNGEFTTTAADGSTISGIHSGTYAPLPSGKIQFNVHVSWLEGTGRLAGVTGEGDVTAVLDAAEPGAAFEYVTRGTLSFPAPA